MGGPGATLTLKIEIATTTHALSMQNKGKKKGRENDAPCLFTRTVGGLEKPLGIKIRTSQISIEICNVAM